MKKSCLISLFALVFVTGSFAQENTLFFVNPYLFNPSYAGVEGRPSLALNYKKQWVNVDGSPTFGSFTFHTPAKKFMSWGAVIQTDKRGLFNTSSALLSGAYTLMLDDYKSIRFGISAGGGVTSLDLDDISDTDPALANGGKSFLQGSAGVSFHLKSFHGGISLPTIFEQTYLAGDPSQVNPLENVVIHASNRFYTAKNKHILEPHLVYRYHKSQPSQVEAALVYHMNNVLWLGGSYKQNFGNSAFLGFHLNKTLGIGYAYTFSTSSNAQLNSPSHEFQLTFLLGKRRKDIPFYSFVDPEKEKKIHSQPKHLSASAAIAQNRANQKQTPQKPAEKKPIVEKPQTQPVAKKTNPPVKTTPATKPVEKNTEPTVAKVEPKKEVTTPPVDKPAPTQPAKPLVKAEVAKLGEMPHVHDTTHESHAEEKERISRLAIHAENPTEHHGDESDDHAHHERHEFVKRGNHSEELEVADYVVAGVFRSKVNAEHFAQGLKQHGFPADHGHLTLKNLWYVYIAATTNIEDAKKERDKYRKMTIFRDSWLLTVHH